MTAFTHAFVIGTGETITIDALRSVITTPTVRAHGFYLISDLSRVVYDRHGRPSRDHGGWSYGHVQGGHICAGAGGVNSVRVAAI